MKVDFFFFCICPQSFKDNIRGNWLKRAFDLALIEVASFLPLLHRSRLMCGATANHPVPLNHSHGLYGGFNQLTISTFVVAPLKIQPLLLPPTNHAFRSRPDTSDEKGRLGPSPESWSQSYNFCNQFKRRKGKRSLFQRQPSVFVVPVMNWYAAPLHPLASLEML